MRFDQVAHDGKSQTQPAVLSRENFIRLPEAVEDVGQKFTRDACAIVVDDQTGTTSRTLQADFDVPTGGLKK